MPSNKPKTVSFVLPEDAGVNAQLECTLVGTGGSTIDRMVVSRDEIHHGQTVRVQYIASVNTIKIIKETVVT